MLQDSEPLAKLGISEADIALLLAYVPNSYSAREFCERLFRFQISDFRFQISDFRFQISDFRFQI